MGLNKAFTLIELIIVMSIISILIVGGYASYTNSFKSSRDGRRKADLASIQRALELYYEDVGAYPANITTGSPLCNPTTPSQCYIQRVPTDPAAGRIYLYAVGADNQSFQLYSCIENSNDNGRGVNQSGYSATNCQCGSPDNLCRFGLSSSNVTP